MSPEWRGVSILVWFSFWSGGDMSASLGFMAALLRRLLRLSLLLAISAWSVTAQGADVAMVTDLQGRATAAREGQVRDLGILAALDAGTVVQLSAGATLVVLYLAAGEEYVFTGPATIALRVGRPETQTGSKPQSRPLTLGAGRVARRGCPRPAPEEPCVIVSHHTARAVQRPASISH